MKSFVALTLLLTVVASNYTIEIKCGYYNCPYGCYQCQVFNGGPFTKYAFCVDNEGGCDSRSTFNMTFTCNGCKNSTNTCSYTIDQAGYYPYIGCTNYDDNFWQSFQTGLNNIYALSTYQGNYYNWCSSACTDLAPSPAVMIPVIVVGIILICVTTGFIMTRQAKKRREQPLMEAENNPNNPIIYSS